MVTNPVRIGIETRPILRELMAKTGQPARVILKKALENYRRKLFLEEANRAFADLKKDRKTWKAELEERKAWDSTLRDGLRER
jgi:hypothetical protein